MRPKKISSLVVRLRAPEMAETSPSPSANGSPPEYWVPTRGRLFLGSSRWWRGARKANLLKLNAGPSRFEFFFLDYQAGPCGRVVLSCS